MKKSFNVKNAVVICTACLLTVYHVLLVLSEE